MVYSLRVPTCAHRGRHGPGEEGVQRQHPVVEAPVVGAGVGVHHEQLPPQVVPVGVGRWACHLRTSFESGDESAL